VSVRTTVVGSWWPQVDAEEELRRYHAGELDRGDALGLLDRCATTAIAEQRALGLAEWTGGEYFTDDWIGHIRSVLSGVELASRAAAEVFDYDDLARLRLVGDVAAPNGLGYAAAFRRERMLPGGVTKATVPGPLEILIQAFADMDAVRARSADLIRIVNNELRELGAAGCKTVQLDGPVYGQLVNMGQMTAAEAADLIAPCFDGVAGRRAIHFCNGNLRGRPFCGVLRCAPWVEILKRLEGVVDIACVEVSYFSQYLEREAFRCLPKSIELAAGIVDEASYGIEPVEKLRSRARDWARVVGEDRLWLSTSCGFGRHPARNRDVLQAKMENLQAAAETV
jgi:methionine synthase II (cobalamin-independent)